MRLMLKGIYRRPIRRKFSARNAFDLSISVVEMLKRSGCPNVWEKTMKLITANIKPFKLDDVHEKALAVGARHDGH